MVLGVFSNKYDAEDAISELRDKGFNVDDISIAMKGDGGRVDDTRTAATSGTTGAVIGGVIGLLAGAGGFLIGGPIAAAAGLTGALASAAAGAATGGVAGALVGIGMSRNDAQLYEESVRSGGILLAAPIMDGDEEEAISVLESHGAEHIKTMRVDMSRIRLQH
ncbi:general stress protein [Candidatus Woesearchaeota archaeon]|nr:general stress protein [Candidatus Woesearchaeota archaeon]